MMAAATPIPAAPPVESPELEFELLEESVCGSALTPVAVATNVVDGSETVVKSVPAVTVWVTVAAALWLAVAASSADCS